MLSTTVLFTSVLLGFAAAQNSTNFDPNSVDLTTKNQWCNGEYGACPLLCGGPKSTLMNQCTGSSLQYKCICANNSAPANIDQYQGTLPNFICEATFAQCRQQNPGSNTCKTCGTLQPTDVPAAATSSAAASSSTASGGSSTAAPAPTTSAKSVAGRVEEIAGVAAVGAVAALFL